MQCRYSGFSGLFVVVCINMWFPCSWGGFKVPLFRFDTQKCDKVVEAIKETGQIRREQRDLEEQVSTAAMFQQRSCDSSPSLPPPLPPRSRTRVVRRLLLTSRG